MCSSRHEHRVGSGTAYSAALSGSQTRAPGFAAVLTVDVRCAVHRRGDGYDALPAVPAPSARTGVGRESAQERPASNTSSCCPECTHRPADQRAAVQIDHQHQMGPPSCQGPCLHPMLSSARGGTEAAQVRPLTGIGFTSLDASQHANNPRAVFHKASREEH